MYRIFQKTVFSHCNGGGRTSFIISPRLSPTNLRRFRAYVIDLYVFVVLGITARPHDICQAKYGEFSQN